MRKILRILFNKICGISFTLLLLPLYICERRDEPITAPSRVWSSNIVPDDDEKLNNTLFGHQSSLPIYITSVCSRLCSVYKN